MSTIGRPRKTIADRFWAKVRKTESCWEWTASKSVDGYGNFTDGSGEKCRAHRIAFELCRGPVPPSAIVCHRCDNPGCVRPEHLFLGSQLDNMRDKVAKAREARGSRNGSAKLNEGQVLEIRRLLAAGETQVAIARRFNVTQANISIIKKNLGWRRVG